jgi:hypothetical protein
VVHADVCRDGTAVWVDDAGEACVRDAKGMARAEGGGIVDVRCGPRDGVMLLAAKDRIRSIDAQKATNLAILERIAELRRSVSDDGVLAARPAGTNPQAFEVLDTISGQTRITIASALSLPKIAGWAGGHAYLVLADDGQVETRSTVDGELRATCDGCMGLGAVSPDGRSFALLTSHELVVVRDGRRRTVARGFDAPTASYQSVAFSPDGTRLVTDAWSHIVDAVDNIEMVRLFDTASWARVALTQPTTRFSIRFLAFRPDSGELALLDSRGGPWGGEAEPHIQFHDARTGTATSRIPMTTSVVELSASGGTVLAKSLDASFITVRLSDGSRARFASCK